MSKDTPQNALSNKHIYISRAFNRAEKIKSKISGHFNLANLIANSKFMTDQEPSIPASKIVSDMSLYASLHASANTDNCIRRIVKILFEMEQFKWKVIK